MAPIVGGDTQLEVLSFLQFATMVEGTDTLTGGGYAGRTSVVTALSDSSGSSSSNPIDTRRRLSVLSPGTAALAALAALADGTFEVVAQVADADWSVRE